MLAPFDTRGWNRGAATHFLARAGFGGTPEEIAAAEAAGMEATVYRALRLPKEYPARPDAVEPINILSEIKILKEKKPDAQKKVKQLQQMRFQANAVLIEWWVEEMRTTRFPLLEKLTLFWHGHFATSVQKVKNPYGMWEQNDTLRRHAMGSFGEMVKAISRDPAMVFWLDLQQSGREHPNENFARELLELFMLGEGNYTEEDVMEAARAFTGYRATRDGGFRIAPFQHDDGEKTFMGRKAQTGDDIIDIVLQQKQCARHIATRLWTYFAYENPAPDLVDTLASRFRRSNYNVRELLYHIFTSAEFYSPKAVGTQIKSPLQWLVQLTRQLGVGLPPRFILISGLRQLGQVPFAPPSVKGWDGGKAWISTASLLTRYNFAKVILGEPAEELMGTGKIARFATRTSGQTQAPDYSRLAPPAAREDPLELVRALAARIYNTQVSQEAATTFVDFAVDRFPGLTDEDIRSLLHLMVSTPYYQLT